MVVPGHGKGPRVVRVQRTSTLARVRELFWLCQGAVQLRRSRGRGGNGLASPPPLPPPHTHHWEVTSATPSTDDTVAALQPPLTWPHELLLIKRLWSQAIVGIKAVDLSFAVTAHHRGTNGTGIVLAVWTVAWRTSTSCFRAGAGGQRSRSGCLFNCSTAARLFPITF